MAEIKPDPAVTSISNDGAAVKGTVNRSVPADIAAVKTEVQDAEANVSNTSESAGKVNENAETKTSNGDKKNENGYRNGDRSERRRDGDRDGKFRDKRDFNNDNRGAYRYRGNGNREQWKRNNKFDPASKEVTDDPRAIRAQVEFYYSDSNLPQDKFLWELCDGAHNKPVSLATIHNFKRMQIFQPYSTVVEALKSSAFLTVEGEEGKEVIKRKEAYDPLLQRKDPREPRSVYVKGFGDEKPSSQFDLEAFFANFGTTNSVRLRRHQDGPDSGLFKGSVFVEFEDEETAKKFLELDPSPKWEGQELKMMSKGQYVQEKVDLIKEGKMAPNENRPAGKFSNSRGGRGNRGGSRDFRPRNDGDEDRDPSDWKKRREDDQKSGFRDDRSRNGRGNRGGRGDRRGRGGRGGSDRRNDRNRSQERDEKKEESAEAAGAEVAAEESKKRGREVDDSGAGDAPAEKKQDVKAEAAAES